MDYSAIIQSATWAQVATAVLLIFAALAGLEVVLRGGRALLAAISNEDGDDYDDSDHDEAHELNDADAREAYEYEQTRRSRFDE